MLKRLIASFARPRHEPGLAEQAARLWQKRDLAGAERLFREQLARAPGSAESHSNLGLVVWEQHRFQEALGHLSRAVELDPSNTTARLNLANAYVIGNRLAQGIEHYREVLRLDPQNAKAHANLLKPLLDACEWDGAAAEVDYLVGRWRADPSDALALRLAPFTSLLVPFPPELRSAIAASHAQRIQERVAGLERPRQAARGARERLRIGYVSGDFHDHATGHLTAGLLEAHDRARFEVYGYSFGIDDGSDYRRRLIAGFDRFVDIAGCAHEEAARRIAADGIDVLIDRKGYTAESRPEIFALRPAPLQVNFLGYPGSMGAGFMDYIVADKVILPEAEVRFFGEQVAWMPASYQANDNRQPISDAPVARAAFGLPEDGFVFCSFNKHYKIERQLFEGWLRILAAVPGSVLWLLGGHGEKNLLRRAREAGIDPRRIVFSGKLRKPEHLARHRLADLFLDTHTVNGHTTTSDALWAGVPVLTWPGPSFAGRVAESLLRAIGLPELVLPDLASYERAAIELAREPARLARLKDKLAANRLATPLFDTEGYARSLESAYETMWRRHAGGQPPARFTVAPPPR